MIFEVAPPEVIAHLKRLCARPGHEFWNDDASLLDESLFETSHILGHRAITDVYLLSLALRQGGTLATFDRSIPLRSVVGANSGHLEVLGV